MHPNKAQRPRSQDFAISGVVLFDVVIELRRSELVGLKWLDVNFEELELFVTRSVYRQRVGRCKTDISRKLVPLDPWLAATSQ